MNEQTCERTSDLLVDFSDGELPESQHAIVERHLLGCPRCRRELSLIEESLRHAKAIWEESAGGYTPGRVGGKSCSRRRRTAPLAATAVAIAVLTFGVWVVRKLDWPEPPVSPEQVTVIRDSSLSPERVTVIMDSSSPADSELALSDINAMLANEAQAARLAASAELLATVPSLKHRANQAEEYLAANYPNSRAGQRALQKLGQTDTFSRTDPEP